jgi:hypothetical protein
LNKSLDEFISFTAIPICSIFFIIFKFKKI